MYKSDSPYRGTVMSSLLLIAAKIQVIGSMRGPGSIFPSWPNSGQNEIFCAGICMYVLTFWSLVFSDSKTDLSFHMLLKENL